MLINAVLYRDGTRVRADGDLADLYAETQRDGGFVWIGIKDPDAAEFHKCAQVFGLHPLAVEDALHAQQRPKIEDYGDQEFLVIKTLFYEESTTQVETGDLMFYIGPNFVITVRHGEGADLAGVRAALELDAHSLKQGPWAVVHSVLDAVVDTYQTISLELERDVADIEVRVFSNERKSWSQQLYFLKREVVEYRRAVDPVRPITNQLARDRQLSIPEEIRLFFRDIDDHLNRAADLVSSLDSLIASAIAVDMTQVQLQQNEDMRKISAWVALAAVPTAVAGIYGMNFDNMPELHSEHGYFVVIGFMAAISGLLFRKFKKANWL